MKIIVGCDHGGYELKCRVISHLQKNGYEVEDVGTYDSQSCDYPVYALKVARAVAESPTDRGVLVCGSGIGMCIAANRVHGVRAVQAGEPFAAKMSRRHNDSNILCLGERFLGVDLAMEIVDAWLEEPFEGGRHQRRVELIDSLSADTGSSEL